MKLGFYYHLILNSKGGTYRVPAYLGVFIDALALEVEQLYLFMHEARIRDAPYCDYSLKGKNIKYITLNHKTPAWERFVLPNLTLRKIFTEVQNCDLLLIRAPSPLAPAFYYRFHKITRVYFLIVGDYLDGIKYLHQPLIRKWAIKILTIRNDRQLKKVIGKTLTLVNSDDLFIKYKPISSLLRVVRTTTIGEQDFYFRKDTCLGETIHVVYTGRLDLAKGLRELILAIAELSKDGFNLILHLAAWEEDPKKPIEKLLSKTVDENNIHDKVVFHGRMTYGEELNLLYRKADIYAIPSYHEGFPRSIWEAMANGLPVISTYVGSIPSFVRDAAILIPPMSIPELVSAFKKVILDQSLRQYLIAEGYKLAKANTLEIRVKEIAEILRDSSKQDV